MKKFLVTLSALTLLLVCLFCVPASAKRYEKMPVTLTHYQKTPTGYGGNMISESIFTITKVELGKPYLLDGEDLYKKSLNFTLYGYFGNDVNADGEIDFILYCYDKKGNHIDTQYFEVSGSYTYESGSHHSLKVPDVTAFVEIASQYPNTWSNSLFIANYKKVWSADGRTKKIPELLLPVYEKVGWFGDIELYALDGRTITVPYPEVEAYKKVGWYDSSWWVSFKRFFDSNFNSGEYSSAYDDTIFFEESLLKTSYIQKLYDYRAKALDAWRKSENNSPVGYLYAHIYQDSGKSNITLNLRNISDKTIKSFTCEITCYNKDGNVEIPKKEYTFNKYNRYQPYTNGWSEPYEKDLEPVTLTEYKFTVQGNVESISKPKITKVVYTDGTVWEK